MRVGLITEGDYPFVGGAAGLWCDRLVRGLDQHEFDVYALSHSRQDDGRTELPPQVRQVRTAPLGPPPEDAPALGRRARRRFTELWTELTSAVCATAGEDPYTSTDGGAVQADRFSSALYGLAELACAEGALTRALLSEGAVHALERACRAPGAPRAVRLARVPELLTVTTRLERALRPLSLDWYGGAGLGSAELCHATGGGSAALPGLLARHLCGVPLLVTEHGVRLRAHYLGATDAPRATPAVRALLAAFHGRLAAEVYARAALVTAGNSHVRRWQERCGADRARLRQVYPGMDAAPFAQAGESGVCADERALVWVGRIDAGKDLFGLLHAFAEVRRELPGTRLRIVGAPAEGARAAACLAQCRVLAAQLFPDEAEGAHQVGASPVSFEEIGSPEVPDLAAAYGAGSVAVLSSVVEGFPTGLVESMLCGRATVSTDVGAVVEVIGGTGLVVPPRNPRALAAACVSLLRDPARRERLGAAARARALELFTTEQNVEAFRGIYLEVVSRCPAPRAELDAAGEPLPFAVPAEAHLPGNWTAAEGGASVGADANSRTGQGSSANQDGARGVGDPDPGTGDAAPEPATEGTPPDRPPAETTQRPDGATATGTAGEATGGGCETAPEAVRPVPVSAGEVAR